MKTFGPDVDSLLTAEQVSTACSTTATIRGPVAPPFPYLYKYRPLKNLHSAVCVNLYARVMCEFMSVRQI